MDNITKSFYVKKMQKFIIVLCGAVIFAASVCGCTKKEEDALLLLTMEDVTDTTDETIVSDTESVMITETVTATETAMIWIHVCGAVNKPGVYELPEGSRIYEAVEAAGGFSEDACNDYINLAQVVNDASRIMIPTVAEAAEGSLFLQDTGVDNQNSRSDNGLVNINVAGVEELCTLPGIGESRAEAIIDYREQNGQFNTIEQIMEVEGIKSGMYSKLQDKICVK